MKRWLVVTINNYPTPAPIAVAEALAAAGIDCDVSVARSAPPRSTQDGRTFVTHIEVRPPKSEGFTVTRVG